ncbi:hypothetical protein HMSSN036_26860 [Paenibacillus macerans]|nr:hypothetical protein HMSSN036_26860 [Paenibacillus macerans]
MLVITGLLALTSQSMFMMLSIAMTVMTLIVSLTSATAQIRKYKNKKKEREKKYLQFIADCRSELTLAREQQIKAMNELNPEPAACLERIQQLDAGCGNGRRRIRISVPAPRRRQRAGGAADPIHEAGDYSGERSASDGAAAVGAGV